MERVGCILIQVTALRMLSLVFLMVGFGQGYLPVWQYIPGFSTIPLFWNTRPAHGVTCGGDRGQARNCDECICHFDNDQLKCGPRSYCGGDCEYKSMGGGQGMCLKKRGSKIFF